MKYTIDTSAPKDLSGYLFGHNLEHTRSAVTEGLSAQMLKNRKFAGKPSRNGGVAQMWESVGDRAFYQTNFRKSYTRHVCCEGMPRNNELNAQSVQNLRGGECGIAQRGISIVGGTTYEARAVAMCFVPVTLRAALTSGDGKTVYAWQEKALEAGDWQVCEFSLAPDVTDHKACIRFTFCQRAEVVFGAVSMMAAGHFHGMRRDVIERLKQIGPTVIRWPGGNFAGEYRWKDGLLPVDMRGPLQAVTEMETQPHSLGYDNHEIGIDEYIALCREVGAEPFVTINLMWNRPEDSADWVEYCNGGPDTEYGRIRAERGHPEPYNVRLWSLGNEMGYGHMEGPMKPRDYAEMALPHARAMKAACPDIVLFSSGPYPNDEWARESAAVLYPMVEYVSLHHYAGAPMDYTSPQGIENAYRALADAVKPAEELLRAMRKSLDAAAPGARISFDEWNVWYAWYRPSCVAEGIFAARMLHMLMKQSGPMDAPVCCYFQPVGEGAVIVTPTDSYLTAIGQMFAMMKPHQGGKLCPVEGDEDGNAAATVKEGVLTVTLINEEYDKERDIVIPCRGRISEGVLFASEEVLPYTRFEETPLQARAVDGEIRLTLPPHSAARLTVELKK